MTTPLISRQYEQKQLKIAYDSPEAEFIAIVGRRRIGKTFLVRSLFENNADSVFFEAAGIHKAPKQKQLDQFRRRIQAVFYSEHPSTRLATPKNWLSAMQMLTDAIDIFAGERKVVLFLDEIPWLSTPKSGLLESLEYYWNQHWVKNSNIKLIICGSAASWIIDNVLGDKGGLHNRVTLRLPMDPFSLSESKAYLDSRGIHFDNQQLLELYMCIGGVPFYLRFVQRGLSAIQNINRLCFQKKGLLVDEYDNLFSSLFDHSEIHENLIKLISEKRYGIERSVIEAKLNYKGGTLTKRLKELEEAGFIMGFVPWGKEKGTYFKVIDEYSLFYLTWIAPGAKSRLGREINTKYWEELAQTPSWRSWSGIAFEAVCYKHLSNIRQAFNIPHSAEASTWRYTPPKSEDKEIHGAQIDLLFDRPDGIIHIFEIKHCSSPFRIDKKYAEALLRKIEIYKRVTGTKKQIFLSFITSSGLIKNIYSEDLVDSDITLDELVG